MADESIWKKEVSFERKSEPPKDENATDTPADDETTLVEAAAERLEQSASVEPDPPSKETLWKREVSFERTPVSDDEPAAEPKETLWKREVTQTPALPDGVEPEATEPEAKEPEPLWTREISFSPKAADEVAKPVAEESAGDVEPRDAEQPVAVVEPVVDAEPELAVGAPEPLLQPAHEPWNALPAMPPAPEVEPPDVVHPPVPAAELPEPSGNEAKVPFWKKDLSFGGKKRDKTPKVEPQVKGEAPANEVEPKVPFWKKDLSFGGKKRDKTPKPEPQVEAEAPVAEVEPKVPFWKKDLSFGSRKRDKTPKVEPNVEAEVPAAEVEPKVPFWKKDLSFGGRKRDKTPKPKADRQPKEPKAPKLKRPKVRPERGAKGAKRIVGLKIGASQLAAAKVSNNGSAELQQVARGPLEAGIVVGGELRDPDALSEALKEFFSSHGLPKRGVRLGISNNRIGVRTFEITGIEDPKQLANAVRFKAQEALPIPIDEAVLDYQVLGEGVTEEGEPTRRILLVVAYRELIDRYVDACKKAGITLSGIDLEAFALLRALQAPQDGVEGDPSAALVVVAIGHERATFAVSDGRVCEFTRVLDWGGSALNVAIARVLDAAPSEVEGAKRALALTDEMVPDGLTSDQAKQAREAMRRAIQAFARELVSSLQYYQNQPGSLGIGEIVLTGGTAHLPGLAGELERLIGVRVRVGDPLARMKIAKKVGEPEQIGSLAIAIGLGIED
jgi:type IV pilus assembly protein PilM